MQYGVPCSCAVACVCEEDVLLLGVPALRKAVWLRVGLPGASWLSVRKIRCM